MPPTLRPVHIAIVGCGKIADQHVEAIRRVPGASIVAVCDREALMAEQLAERFAIPESFSDLNQTLDAIRPDVVHITTPPQSHYSIAKQCLEFGSNVYLEKPFTVSAEEAESLINAAKIFDLYVTAGHNYQFTPEMLRMRQLVRNGTLGGKPVHVESYWSYDLGDRNYMGPILGNRGHWVRQLPGQLLHNVISHGVARLVEFLDDDIIEVNATAHQSEHLQKLGGQELLDELRVSIRDRSGTTASFCFSTQMKGVNQLRIYGPAAAIFVDNVTGSVIRTKGRTYKSYLTYFVPPLEAARQNLRNAGLNVLNFTRRRLYQDFGMTELIGRFVDTIRTRSEPPIAYREIILTARIMDQIFGQVYPERPQAIVVEEKTSDTGSVKASTNATE
jgi:predicted dehydrogenase